MHDVAMLIKSLFNKNQNYYFHSVFLEKRFYQLTKHK